MYVWTFVSSLLVKLKSQLSCFSFIGVQDAKMLHLGWKQHQLLKHWLFIQILWKDQVMERPIKTFVSLRSNNADFHDWGGADTSLTNAMPFLNKKKKHYEARFLWREIRNVQIIQMGNSRPACPMVIGRSAARSGVGFHQGGGGQWWAWRQLGWSEEFGGYLL